MSASYCTEEDTVHVHHLKGRLHHLRCTREIDPYLEKLGGIVFLRVDQGKHLAVYDSPTSCHPLQVPLAVSTCITHGVRVIYDPLQGGCDGLEPSVRMLWEARYAFSMVHAVGAVGIEVRSVSGVRRLHVLIPGRIHVSMIHAEQERVHTFEGKGQWLHTRDQTLHEHRPIKNPVAQHETRFFLTLLLIYFKLI